MGACLIMMTRVRNLFSTFRKPAGQLAGILFVSGVVLLVFSLRQRAKQGAVDLRNDSGRMVHFEIMHPGGPGTPLVMKTAVSLAPGKSTQVAWPQDWSGELRVKARPAGLPVLETEGFLARPGFRFTGGLETSGQLVLESGRWDWLYEKSLQSDHPWLRIPMKLITAGLP